MIQMTPTCEWTLMRTCRGLMRQGIAAWWQTNAGAYPAGRRTFMGAPVTTDSCVGVLRTGYQRQRRVAALHVALHSARTPLFEWRAPAWRQRRKLQ